MKRFLLLLAIAACSKSPADKQPPPGHVAGPVQKDPDAAKQLIAQGAPVLDVRSPDEFAGGHLAQATNMPLPSLDVAAVDKLVGGDKSQPIVVYCSKGGRAQKAKDKLETAGFTHIVNGGGYDDLSP